MGIVGLHFRQKKDLKFFENGNVQNAHTTIRGVLGTFDVSREGASVMDADFLNSHVIDNFENMKNLT